MAHPNIEERREYIASLLELGIPVYGAVRKQVSEMFGCTSGAIMSDLGHFQRPRTKESAFANQRVKRMVRDRDGATCQYCGRKDLPKPMVEHVIPAFLGGVGKLYNLVISCQSCNTTKRRSTWIPNNLDAITRDDEDWRLKVISMAKR